MNRVKKAISKRCKVSALRPNEFKVLSKKIAGNSNIVAIKQKIKNFVHKYCCADYEAVKFVYARIYIQCLYCDNTTIAYTEILFIAVITHRIRTTSAAYFL